MTPPHAATEVKVTRQAARRFLVRRTGLGRLPGEKPVWTDPGGAGPGGAGPGGTDPCGAHPRGTVEAVRALGYVQVDPMQVLARNQDLVLGARVQGYRPESLEKALYQERTLVEVLARNRYIVPVEDYPVFRVRFAQYEQGNRPRLRELEPVMEKVLRRIESDGPLCSLDFDDDERVSGWWEPDGQARTRAVRQALEWLWHFGRVAINHRVGARRYFDLPERLFGPQAERLPYKPPLGGAGAGAEAAGAGPGAKEPDLARRLLRGYLRAMGLADLRDWSFGWSKYSAPEKMSIADGLVAAGELVPVTVEGCGGFTYYAPSDQLGELMEAAVQVFEPAMHILPPLDNLIWLRGRLADLFGFDYSWEAYVPENKRRYGPYTCPILRGDGLVGRVDARTDRQAGAVVIRGLWWEPGVPPAPADELRPALERLAAAAGVERFSDPDGLLSG